MVTKILSCLYRFNSSKKFFLYQESHGFISVGKQMSCFLVSLASRHNKWRKYDKVWQHNFYAMDIQQLFVGLYLFAFILNCIFKIVCFVSLFGIAIYFYLLILCSMTILNWFYKWQYGTSFKFLCVYLIYK